MSVRRLVSAAAAVALVGATALVVAPPASAATIDVTRALAAYPLGTSLADVRLPGLTFTVGTDARAIVIDGGEIAITGGGSLDLLISVSGGTAFSTDYAGAGDSCGNDNYDILSLAQSGSPVAQLVTGRLARPACESGTFAQNVDFDSFAVDVQAGQSIGLTSLVLDADLPAAPSPDILHSVPLPTTGMCADVDESTLPAGVSDFKGGWSHSWAQWANGGKGGDVCVRTVKYSGAQGRWVVDS